MLNIQDIEDLAERIRMSSETLRRIGREIDRHVEYAPQEKPNGDVRHIYRPSPELKSILRSMNTELLQPIPLPKTLQGSVPTRSPLTNAQIHSGQPYVISIDIKDFYPSIHYKRVEKLFLDLGCSANVARTLTRLTTYNYCLVQGFPTSSSIANLLLKDIAPRYVQMCDQHKLRFSFYQDDLTISGSDRAPKLFNLIVRILEQSGFTINKMKSQIRKRNEKQKVTGYVVNDAVNVPKAYYREVKKVIHYCNRFGVESQTDTDIIPFLQSLRGKIEWVNSVNPQKGVELLVEFEKIPETKQL